MVEESQERSGENLRSIFTTKPVGEGTGLGLDCYRIIEAHKGKSRFYQQLGTKFIISLSYDALKSEYES